MNKRILLRLIQVSCLLVSVLVTNVYAMETSLQLHKVGQEKSYGYSLSVGDEFFNQKAFIWNINYNRFENVRISDLDDISEEWDDADLDFRIQTLDLSLGYRYYPRSYNKLTNSIMLEFQLGASVNLSDHKLVFPDDLMVDDIYFADRGDINPVMSVSIQKSFTKKFAMQLGFKHYPSFSEFGSFSSFYLGFNYRFGNQIFY